MRSLKLVSTVFFLLLALTVLVGTFAARHLVSERLVLPIATQANDASVSTFAPRIYRKYVKFFPFLPCETDRCPNTDAMQADLKAYFDGLPVLGYRLYSREGKYFMGDALSERVNNAQAQAAVKAALAKQKTSFFETSYLHHEGDQRHAVRSFYPILPDGEQLESAPLVLEVIYDATAVWGTTSLTLNIILGVGVTLCFIMLGSIMWMTVSIDKVITKQYEANAALVSEKQAAEVESREKSQFLANVSHELRTPLNAIIGFSEIIKDEVMGPLNNKEYKDYITDIHSSGVHLLSLINDILDYSKADAGKLTVEFADVDVTKILKNSLRLVMPRAQEAKVQLIDRVPKDHHILRTDGKRVKQVVLNLFSNAVKFTPEGGSVTLFAWNNMEEDKFVIEVQDTGVGIAPKDISKVMATFGQVENKLSRRYEGTGLGLPLCKKLVELMNGTMEIESEVGEGTTVRVVLPYVMQDKDKAAAAEQPHKPEKQTPATRAHSLEDLERELETVDTIATSEASTLSAAAMLGTPTFAIPENAPLQNTPEHAPAMAADPFAMPIPHAPIPSIDSIAMIQPEPVPTPATNPADLPPVSTPYVS